MVGITPIGPSAVPGGPLGPEHEQTLINLMEKSIGELREKLDNPYFSPDQKAKLEKKLDDASSTLKEAQVQLNQKPPNYPQVNTDLEVAAQSINEVQSALP